MTIPALIRLQERYPNAIITLLAPRKLVDLWIGQPMIHEIIAIEPKDSILNVAHKIREGRHDLGLALPNSHRSALELWLGGIRQRVGRALPFRSWLLTHAVPARTGMVSMRKRNDREVRQRCASECSPEPIPPITAHQIYDYLHLVAALGASPIPVAPRILVSREEIQSIQRRFGLAQDALWLGLNPGAEYGPAKRWPRDLFIAAGVELQRRTGCRWALLGGPGDVDLAHEIERGLTRGADRTVAEKMAPVNLAGRTSLRELCGALGCCRALLSNDTGPAHLAAALGIPVVVPFGSTSPELTGPGLPGETRHRLLRRPVACSPCFLRDCPVDHRCMTGIAVDDVVAATLQAVAASGD